MLLSWNYELILFHVVGYTLRLQWPADMNIEWPNNWNRGIPVPAARMKGYTDLCCRVYSQRAMAPLTWTFSDLTTPSWGISMQASKIWIISTGIPSFSRPRTRTCRQTRKLNEIVYETRNTSAWLIGTNACILQMQLQNAKQYTLMQCHHAIRTRNWWFRVFVMTYRLFREVILVKRYTVCSLLQTQDRKTLSLLFV